MLRVRAVRPSVADAAYGALAGRERASRPAGGPVSGDALTAAADAVRAVSRSPGGEGENTVIQHISGGASFASERPNHLPRGGRASSIAVSLNRH